MNRQQSIGKCDSCGKSFPYYLIHNGFNESAYAYCDSCGITVLLDGWKVPKGIPIEVHKAIEPETEGYLSSCDCGGRFKHSAAPRCPHCHSPLSAESAREWIEGNAPGTPKSRHWWQCSWTGLYAVIVDNRFVEDKWKEKASNQGV